MRGRSIRADGSCWRWVDATTIAVHLESKLIGGAIQENKEATRNASPTSYVSKDDSPFMLIHGTMDPAVPFNQSELLAAALKKVGVEALFVPVTGGGHGNFGSPEVPHRVKQFFDKHLLGKDIAISTEAIKTGERTPAQL